MKLGIDFGTTRIVVAAVDRGNYPLVHFETPDGVYDEWFPSLVSLRPANSGMQHAERRYGWDAWQGQSEPGWINLRSIKRYLEHAGPETRLSLHGAQVPVTELLHGLLSSLRSALAAQFGAKEPLEAMLGVPANANNNQRFLTVDAFRRAGFSVLGLLNEPSAASIEFGHRQKSKGRILVYDLGGGTFDVSLVSMEDGTHTVLASEGISNLGGDDFDIVLAELAAGREVLHSLTLAEMFRLDEECRRQKEALHPNSRKIVIDLDVAREGLGQAVVPVAEFYEHCRPLLDESLALTLKLAPGENIEALYVTGGGSELPMVTRLLREEFGRKVTRSEYTRSATAIGLAIQADSASGYKLREMFTRDFGVWREGQGGERMIFDPIFLRGTRLPSAGDPPLSVSRVYRPVHNIGDFRFIEASHLGHQGEPAGDIAVWDEILFPFDPALRHTTSLEGLQVLRSDAVAAEEIEESYACDAAGVVNVTIRNLQLELFPRIPPQPLEWEGCGGCALRWQARSQSHRVAQSYPRHATLVEMQVPIKRAIERVPGGMMIVPLVLGAVIVTFAPGTAGFFGSFTGALFTGSLPILAVFYVCLGATIPFEALPRIAKRGGALLATKIIVGILAGLVLGHLLGERPISHGWFAGISTLAVVAAINDTNGGLYMALMEQCGRAEDAGAYAVMSLESGPFLTMLTLGVAGLSAFPWQTLVGAILPLVVGLMLGNLDHDLRVFLGRAAPTLIPFFGFALGATLDLHRVWQAGMLGLALGLCVVAVSGAALLIADRLTGGTGTAGLAAATTAGNAAAVPAIVASANPAYAEAAASATVLVAASVIVTALCAPPLTIWWASRTSSTERS